jgi:rubrerythrin
MSSIPLDSQHMVKTKLTPDEFAKALQEQIKAHGVDKIEDPMKKGAAIAALVFHIQAQSIDGESEAVKFYKSRLDRALRDKVQEMKREMSVAEFQRWRRAVESGEIKLQ